MIWLLIMVAIMPSIVLGFIIYKKDKEKEPIKLLFLSFLGGLGAIIFTLIDSYVIFKIFPNFEYAVGEGIIKLVFYVFVGIALIEEFAKWLFTYIIGYRSKEFNHIYDGIVYAVFVALGFATVENVLYVLESSSFVLAFIRAILSVPVHAFCGVLMGYYLGLAKTKKNKMGYLFLSLFIPVLFHGAFNTGLLIISYEIHTIAYLITVSALLLILVVLLYVIAIKRIKRLSSIIRNIDGSKMKMSYCIWCGTLIEGSTNFCFKCGNRKE